MGSEFVSYEWAANLFGKSKRMVHNYITDGFLTKHKDEQGKPALLRSEVEAFKLELEGNTRSVTRKTVLQLDQRVKQLEAEMNTVRHILEIRNAALRPTASEANGLRRAAADAVGRGSWSLDEVELWASQFEKVDEKTIEAFALAAPNDPKPWEEFYRLALAIMGVLEEGEQSLTSSALWRKIDEGRKKLRASVLVWFELHPEPTRDRIFDQVSTPMERVSQRASRARL